MANIRRVTMNPPTMLMVAINTEIDASTQTNQLPVPICNSAPRMMMPEIALVTAISGVCKAWLTFQMTWNPTKHAKTNTPKQTQPFEVKCGLLAQTILRNAEQKLPEILSTKHLRVKLKRNIPDGSEIQRQDLELWWTQAQLLKIYGAKEITNHSIWNRRPPAQAR